MDSLWLQTQFRLNPEKSKADLADALGLDRPAVSKILAGTRQIKAAEYAAMRRFFGLPVDGERAAKGGSTVTLQPLTAGMSDNPTSEDGWVMPASVLAQRTRGKPENIRIFTVQERAMAPELLPGETVLVDLSDVTPSPPGIFVVADGLGHIIRRCAHVPQSNPPQIRITAVDAQYESHTTDLARAGIVGRVIAKLQWL